MATPLRVHCDVCLCVCIPDITYTGPSTHYICISSSIFPSRTSLPTTLTPTSFHTLTPSPIRPDSSFFPDCFTSIVLLHHHNQKGFFFTEEFCIFLSLSSTRGIETHVAPLTVHFSVSHIPQAYELIRIHLSIFVFVHMGLQYNPVFTRLLLVLLFYDSTAFYTLYY